jgi:hypothetical protein
MMGRPRAESRGNCTKDRIPTITVLPQANISGQFFRGPLRAFRDSLLFSVTLPCPKYLSTSVAKLAASVVARGDKSPNQPDEDIHMDQDHILFKSSHAVRSQSLLNILALAPKISQLVIAFLPFHYYGG